MRARCAAVALVAALGAGPAGQQPEVAQAPSQDVPSPTFRAGIRAVQVDVFVTDEQGTPVTGLTEDDFEIFENGTAQPIATFEAIDVPHPSLAPERPLAEPDVLANDRPAGRVYLIALDEVQPCNALRTRHLMRDFLDRFVGPDDVAAVVLLGRGFADTGQDFTSNRRLLAAALDRFSGGFPRFEDECEIPMRSDARQLTSSLRALTEMMARVEGRHKSMLFISEGIGFDMFDIIDYHGESLTPAGWDAHAALSAATRSHLTIYTIDPAGLRPGLQTLEDRSSLTALATATGGFHLGNSNNFTAAFERILRESSTYYMLGFNSAYEKDDGRFVRLEVRVRRPGLKVHARDGYVAPTRDQRRAETRTAAARSAIGEAMASPFATRGLGLRVTAAPHRGQKKEATVSLVVDVDPSALRLVERSGRFTGELEARFLATDAKSKVYPESRLAATLALRPETYARVSSHGLRIVSQMALPKGRYQLRVAAGSGLQTGSVVYDLEVPDFGAAPVTLSGVSLAALPDDGAVTMRGDRGPASPPARCRPPAPCTPAAADMTGMALWSVADAPGADAHVLQGALPAAPTTRRTFQRDQTLAVFVEVYDNRRRNDTGDAIEVTASLRNAEGEAVRSASSTPSPAGANRPSGGRRVTLQLPLAGIDQGAYTLHVQAGAPDQPTQTAERRLPLRIN